MKKHVSTILIFAALLLGLLLLVSCDDKQEASPCAEGHTFEEEVLTAPTCTEAGLLRRFCTVCNTVREEELPAAGHKEGDWEITQQPTCTEEGVRCAFCVTCGEQLSVQTVSAKGHSTKGEWVIDREPTCTEKGLRHTAECSECGEIDVVEEMSVLGHVTTDWQTVSVATCSAAGERQKICSRCKDVLASETIGALGHVFGAWQKDRTNTARVSHACGRTGCNESEEYVLDVAVTESGAHTTYHLTGVSLSYDSGVSAAFQEKMTALASRIYGFTNVLVSAKTAAGTQKVIRVQTGSDAAITGHGFAIKCEGNLITVVGTTPLITQMGVDYLMNHYVTGEAISLPALAVSDAFDMIDVTGFDVIYSDALDDLGQGGDETARDPDAYYGVSSETGRDYAVDVAFDIATQITALASSDSCSVTSREILIGKTNRTQSAIALAYLKGHEYGIMMIDGRLVLAGYATAALHKAAPLLYDYLNDAKDAGGRVLLPAGLCLIGEASDRWLTDETLLPDLTLYGATDDGEGAFQYLYKGSGVYKETFDAYVAALKQKGFTVLTENAAEGSCFVTLANAQKTQMLHVSFEAYAHASDTKAGGEWAAAWGADPAIRVITAYVHESYSKKIESIPKPSGYKSSKETKTYLSGVRSVTFTYQSKPSLDTYRNKFLSQGYVEVFADNVREACLLRNTSTGEWVEIFVTGAISSYSITRRSYAPGVITLPSSELLSPNQSYEKVTDSKIVAIDLSAIEANGVSASYGTGYVIMLEDGRFVIIDGGAADGDTSGENAFAQVENFWSVLCALYKDVYGVAPSPSNPAHIAAWIITHGHGDHMAMFWDFCDRYGGGNGSRTLGAYVTIDYLLANSPDYTSLYNTGEPNMNITNNMSKLNGYVKNGFTYIRVQTGQKLYFADLEIETLFTQSNHHPQRIVTMNDASAIQRLTFVRTADGVGARAVDHAATAAASKTSFLSTGDAYRWSGRWIVAMYGGYLRSDMVTLSHHGGVGFTDGVYDMISPSVVWKPARKSTSAYAPSSSWNGKVNQRLTYDIDSVTYIYNSDDYHITLVLKEAGPDYDGIYHATDKTAIRYYTAVRADLKTGSGKEHAARSDMRAAQCVAIKKI